jgi:hypothetical protein
LCADEHIRYFHCTDPPDGQQMQQPVPAPAPDPRLLREMARTWVATTLIGLYLLNDGAFI